MSAEVIDPEHPDFPLRLDPGKPMIISAFGRKGSGKSVFNRTLYGTWAGDKLCIDVNGNAEPGEDAERVPTPLPTKWPAPAPALGERRRPRNLHYRANPGSATYRDDLDRAVAMALFPQDHQTLLWAGEVGELVPNGNPGPHMRTLLMQNRHYKVTALFDAPRPVSISPLVIAQSNLIAVYQLPNPHDRKRIAQEFGWPPKKFDEVCHETWRRGDHWFVLCDADRHELYACPPLPIGEPAAAR